MKRTIILLSMFIWINITASAQSHESVKFQIDRFEKEAGRVLLSYEIGIDKYQIGNRESIFLTPYLKKGDHVLPLEPVIITGKGRKQSFDRYAAIKGTERGYFHSIRLVTTDEAANNGLSFNREFPYQEWMNGSTLYVKQNVWGCAEDVSESVTELAKLVVPEPVVVEPEPQPEPQPSILHKEGTAYIDFRIGRSDIDLDFGSNRYELSRIGKLVSEISNAPNAKIIGLEITGFASPDGPYAVNDRLSRERAGALSQQINLYYKLNLSPGQIQIENVAEDWDGLTRMVEESSLPYREDILNIIRTIQPFDERERALMRLGGGNAWRTLNEDFLPKLRRTEYRILYQIEK